MLVELDGGSDHRPLLCSFDVGEVNTEVIAPVPFKKWKLQKFKNIAVLDSFRTTIHPHVKELAGPCDTLDKDEIGSLFQFFIMTMILLNSNLQTNRN